MVFREIEGRDRDAWVRMRDGLWPESEGVHRREVEDFFAGRLTIPEAVIIAEVDGQVAGFAELSIRPYAEGCRTNRVGYLEGWYVDPAQRRRGLGRGLVSAAEAWARSAGCTEFASDASPDNDGSIAAHLACGFDNAGMVVCFSKSLQPGPGGAESDGTS